MTHTTRRKIFLLAIVGSLCAIMHTAHAENMSVGVGPSGHFYFVNGNPALSTGLGGHIFFDYRWAPQISTQFSVNVTTQDGKRANSGDNDLLLFSIPTVDFKYYFLKSGGRFDPYGLLGVGFFLISEGSRSDGTFAVGFGADAGAGIDFYLTPTLSTNLAAVFHSIGMIGALKGDNGSGLFPFATTGSLAFHF